MLGFRKFSESQITTRNSSPEFNLSTDGWLYWWKEWLECVAKVRILTDTNAVFLYIVFAFPFTLNLSSYYFQQPKVTSFIAAKYVLNVLPRRIYDAYVNVITRFLFFFSFFSKINYSLCWCTYQQMNITSDLLSNWNFDTRAVN